MSDRAMRGMTQPPATRRELERTLWNLKHEPDLPQEQLDAFDEEIERLYPGGFDRRDEANALVVLAVRHGPIKNLHAGKYSPLLEDESLSRLTDADIKAIMVYASRMVTFMLWLRDTAPEVYRRWVQAYGGQHCRQWER